MVVERQNNEIVIRLPGSMNIDAIQKMVDYFNVMEITSQNQGTEEEAAELARQVNKNWWSQNRHRLIK